MKKRIVLTFFLIICSALSLLATEKLHLKVGTYENPPKIFTDENGEISGFWADITEEIAKLENWEIQWVHGTWDQCLQRLENNEIDIMVDVGLTPKRQERFAFSKETVLLSWVRIYKKNGSDIQTILDLEGKKIAGLKGSFDLDGPEGLKKVTREFKINCEIIEMEHYDEIFQALDNKQIDAGVVDKDFGNIHSINFNIEKTSIILQPAYMNFALSKKANLTPYLIERIDAQIRELKKNNNSIYYHSIDKHLGGDDEITFLPLWLKLIFIIIFLLTVIFFIFINILRHQVKKKTAQLQKSEEKYRLLFENSPATITVFDTDYKLVMINRTEKNILQGGRSDLIGKTIYELFPNMAELYVNRFNSIIKERKAMHFEDAFDMPDGKIWLSSYLQPLLNENDEAEQIQIISLDITEHKRAEEEIIKLSKIVETTSQYVVLTKIDGTVVYVNKAYLDVSGYKESEVIGLSMFDFTSDEGMKILSEETIPQLLSTGHWQGEMIVRMKDGTKFPADLICSLIKNENGKPEYFVAVFNDITERKKAEEQIKKDLEIQTALIQEIYHRTKNNMAVISAMLSMESDRSENDQVKSTFKEIDNKIRAMSMVHQKLYEAKDLSSINMEDYIKDLVELIMQSYGVFSERVTLNFDLHAVKVSIDSAVPFGLIINELISNIFKHAFPEDRKGEISIRLFKEEDETINLELNDNGVGFLQNFDPRKDGSMGLTSVFSLVEEQLKGEISVKSENGLKWHIKIKDNLHKERV